ncbi:hypothetical protein Y032_0202g1790 [Ancylostoma ceylanicum]|uniref:Reverse transcriptase domain-containing protein n=1 Tax=Ancylostoma ceylanicum TaxID=53326 RepID=A0A016SN51_9BILA|nr:hypothetical protein Y032_0202g1790 [Ancylostoma ceylanicum]
METKMLRWTAGVTRADRIRNKKIRERFGIAPIADKLRETRLRWYGHVLRANKDTICKVGLNLEVPGKRPKGRPKQRWLDTLHADLKHVGVHPDQARDRVKWQSYKIIFIVTICDSSFIADLSAHHPHSLNPEIYRISIQRRT